MVPLALSAPGRPPGTGEEVVLAAGAADGAGEDQAATHGFDVTDADALDGAGSDTSGTEHDVTGASASGRTTTATTKKKKKAAAKVSVKASPKTTTTQAPPTTEAAAAVVAARAPSPPPPPTAAPPPTPPPVAGGDAVWDRLAVCESSNTNDPGAPYYGYWQFSAGTWLRMGQTGLPNEFSREHQLVVAKRLQAASGWGQWPDCSRQLGLR